MDAGTVLVVYAEAIKTALTECFVNNPLLLAATGVFGFFGIMHSFREYLKEETPWTVALDTLLLIVLTAALSPFVYPIVLLTALPIGALSAAYCAKKRRNQGINRALEEGSRQANKEREELITFVYDGELISLIQSTCFINAERCLQTNRPQQAIFYLNQCGRRVQRQPDYLIRYAQALKLMENYPGTLAKLNLLPPEAVEKRKIFVAAMELRADCFRRMNRYTEELECYEAIIGRGHQPERYCSLLGQAGIRILERSPYLPEAREALLSRAPSREAFAAAVLRDLDRALHYGTQYQAEILSYKADCLLCVGEEEKALSLLKESDRLKPDIANNAVCFGLYYLGKNNLGRAEVSLKKGIDRDPLDDRAHFYLAKLYYEKKDYDEAILSASKSLALFPARHEGQGIQGKCYLEKKMYDEAVPHFTQAIALHPTAEYFHLRAQCHYFSLPYTHEKNQRAYQDAQAALDLEKTLGYQIEVLKYQAAVWGHEGRKLPKEEIAALLAQFGGTEGYDTQIGSIYYFYGYLDEAETYFRKEYEKHRSSRAYAYNYALVLRKLGRSKEAAALLDKVYRPDLDDIKFYDLVLDCRRDIGDSEGIEEVLHEIDRAETRYMAMDKHTGDGLFQIKKYAAAAEYYRSALGHVDSSAPVCGNLACAYIRMERYDDAVEQLRKALRLDGEYPPAHYNLGCCYLLMGRGQKAYESFKTAQRLGLRGMTREEIDAFDDEMTEVLLGLDTAEPASGEVRVVYC